MMDDKFIVFEQRLIDGVVVSVCMDAHVLTFVKEGGGRALGDVQCRMRLATE